MTMRLSFMPIIATLTTTTDVTTTINVATFTLHYKRNCEKIEETFSGNASQLEAMLQQRSLEKDYQKKNDFLDQKSQLITPSLIKKVSKAMAVTEKHKMSNASLIEVSEEAPALKRLKTCAALLTSTGSVVPLQRSMLNGEEVIQQALNAAGLLASRELLQK